MSGHAPDGKGARAWFYKGKVSRGEWAGAYTWTDTRDDEVERGSFSMTFVTTDCEIVKEMTQVDGYDHVGVMYWYRAAEDGDTDWDPGCDFVGSWENSAKDIALEIVQLAPKHLQGRMSQGALDGKVERGTWSGTLDTMGDEDNPFTMFFPDSRNCSRLQWHLYSNSEQYPDEILTLDRVVSRHG